MMTQEEGSRLNSLEFIGDGTVMFDQIADMIAKTPLFTDIDWNDIRLLASYMQLYRAEKGTVILNEGDPGDYMLVMIDGKVDVLKHDIQHRLKHITTLEPGEAIGEMAMVDGEPRFATCVAGDSTVFAVLSRDTLARMIDDEPRLGAKILVQLLAMVNQRLRQTSSMLVNYLKVS